MLQSTADFWQAWKEFEIKHGNEDTVREMLRIKRSVQAMYNTQVQTQPNTYTSFDIVNWRQNIRQF